MDKGHKFIINYLGEAKPVPNSEVLLKFKAVTTWSDHNSLTPNISPTESTGNYYNTRAEAEQTPDGLIITVYRNENFPQGTWIGTWYPQVAKRMTYFEIIEWHDFECFRLTAEYDFKVPDYLPKTCTDCTSMFSACKRFNCPNVTKWDVSNVLKMIYTFAGCQLFNQPLRDWNVKNVLTMMGMFRNCYSFNQPLGKWNISNVDDFNIMFNGALAFDKNPNWDIKPTANIKSMFVKSGVPFYIKLPNGELPTRNLLNDWTFDNWNFGAERTDFTHFIDPKWNKTLIGNLLINIEKQCAGENGIISGPYFDFGPIFSSNTQYSPEAVSAAQKLVARGWSLKSE